MPIPLLRRPSNPQRVHVGIWYILRAQRGSHIPTLRPKYTPYSYMDPLGLDLLSARSRTDYSQCRVSARSSVVAEAQKSHGKCHIPDLSKSPQTRDTKASTAKPYQHLRLGSLIHVGDWVSSYHRKTEPFALLPRVIQG